MNSELKENTELAHYRIVSKIGAGGMGEVYLAQDTKLDRKVALKMLPADLAANQDRMRRFVQEARAAAALNHPNIAHIYEIGEADGTHFIAMEFIDGVTLREKIYRDKAPLSKLLKYLNQVAEGLSKAHAAGIVHRDLKPDNIMITRDDYAKVLDFGLAKLVEGHGDAETRGRGDEGETLIAASPHLPVPASPVPPISPSGTSPGIIMGTVGYMSPEQASGRVQEIDHRSDIFSFGCILFEAATGQMAFEGKDVLDSLHKIVHAPTPQLKDVNPLAPDDLQRVVRRCLAKEPEKRYQSMKELAIEIDDLQEVLKSQTGFEYARRPASAANAATSGSTTGDEGFWVAVLPFKYTGSNSDLTAVAEGLSEDIITGLSRFSYLRVIARGSTLHYANQTTDLREIGKELGARYVMEGNLRQAGTKLRITVQLVDAINGAHLWAENYERSFSPESVFELQDELVPRIVSTVADLHGVLPHSMSAVVRLKPPELLSPYEAVLRSFGYTERVTAEELADALACLELAVQKVPSYADALAMLASYYTQDHGQGFDLRTDPLSKAEDLARKAVEIAPANHLAWISLAQVHFFQKEFQTFTNAAERAVALNPMDGNSMATLGEMFTFAGNWERGLELVELAKQLNPNHPGWYWYANFHRAYQERDYESALNFALKVNLPSHWVSPATIAAAYGQLGQPEAAAKAVRDMLKLRPEVASTVRINLEKWWTAEDVEQIIEGLRKAGLQIPGKERRAEEAAALAETRAVIEPSRSIAVLPFVNISNDEENEYFCDGLAEELLNALSKIEALRVAARTSAFSFKGKGTDVREIGRKLNVSVVLEGSVRKAGNRLRITAQLINVADGYQLWSERYDREMRDIFDVQDEISLAILDALKVKLLGVEKAAVLKRYTRNTEAYQLYLKGRYFFYRFPEPAFAKARDCFQQAIDLDPNFALGYCGLADYFGFAACLGLIPPDEGWPKMEAAINKAVALDDRSAEVDQTKAAISVYYYRDWPAAERNFKLSIELNPNYAEVHRHYAICLAFFGRTEEALAEMRRALQLDSLSVGVNHWLGQLFFWLGRYDEAIEQYRRTLELDASFAFAHELIGDAYEQKAQHAEAIAAWSQALVLQGNSELAGLLDQTFAASGFDAAVHALAQKQLEGLRERKQRGAYIPAMEFVKVYLRLGDREQTAAWLAKAVQERNGLVLLIQVEPRYESLRSDPQFTELARQIGFTQ